MKAFKTLLILMMVLTSGIANAKVISMAAIDLGYGKLDINAGSGHLKALVDNNNRLVGISVNAYASLLGIDAKINEYLDVPSLAKGEPLNFYMNGAKSAILVVKALGGFGVNGGKLKFSVLESDGYHSTILEVERGASTKQFRVYKDQQMINQINLNIRGYSIADMLIGWYELKSE